VFIELSRSVYIQRRLNGGQVNIYDRAANCNKKLERFKFGFRTSLRQFDLRTAFFVMTLAAILLGIVAVLLHQK
jgi:hypothetical protein